jgi:curved DNA-binding protein CbpA
MYEILEVSPDASDSEIQAAHQRLTQQLKSEQTDSNREDIEFKLRVVTVAFNALSVKRTRDAYDSRLAALNAPANVDTSLSLVPLPPKVEAASLKAEAISLKAEALSLKADAVSLRADVMTLRVGGEEAQPPERSALKMFADLLSPIRGAFSILSSLVALGLIVFVIFMLTLNQHAERAVTEASKAQEKVILQNYYQEHGVRAASVDEVVLLNRQQSIAAQEERARQEQQWKVERADSEARQYAEQVSHELRYAEEQTRREEEYKRRQQEEEQRNQEEAERRRIENEMNRWRN